MKFVLAVVLLSSSIVGGSVVDTRALVNTRMQPGHEPPSISLRCKVDQINISVDGERSATADLAVTAEIVNTGHSPIILLNREPVFPGAYLLKDTAKPDNNNLLDATYNGPSIDNSQEWRVLRSVLDQRTPPIGLTRTLMPTDSWLLKARLFLAFDGTSHSLPKRPTLKEVEELPQVWLRVVCDVWPFNVEPSEHDSTAIEKKPFGHKLQRRWSKIGLYGSTASLSEPALLDLRTPAHG